MKSVKSAILSEPGFDGIAENAGVGYGIADYADYAEDAEKIPA